MHSLNVYHALHDSFFTEGESEESYAICALLHDLCKANYYTLGTRNVKNEATGQWEKAPFYSVEDLFPYGRGVKSVYLVERFMKLRVEEAVTMLPVVAVLPSRRPTTSTRWRSNCTSQTCRLPT